MPSQARSKVNKRARALVTGGAIRLGRAIALALADAGMDVAIGYHRSHADAARTVHALERRGARAMAIRADLTRAGSAGRLVEAAASALGGLDVLVNSAAVFPSTPFMTVTLAEYERVLALNLRAPFFCAQAASAVMPAGGHIVNVGDAAVERPLPGYLPYAISKAALAALTRHLAAAVSARGISVNCVAPGPVVRPPRFPRARWHAITRGQAVAVDDVTAAVTFLATCPRSVTGQTIAVDIPHAR